MSLPPEAVRALVARAAALAAGTSLDTLPNPPVGCVVAAADGRVLGEGRHLHYGGAHAEAAALAAAGTAARGATVVATLEPCGADAGGKKTPPCAPALRAAGIAALVYAAEDPSPHAAGRGVAVLEEAGIAVLRVESPEAAALLRRWRGSASDPLPWTIAKWAMTLDGKIADVRGASRWISGEASRAHVRALRARVDAVVVGSRTAALDDPDLRPGDAAGRVPLRVVVDGGLRLGPSSRLAATAREAPVLVACGEGADGARRAALERAGVEVLTFPGADARVDLRALFLALRARGVRRLLLEGGGELNAAALRSGLVRQAAVFIAPTLLGGRIAPGPVGGDGGVASAAAPLRLEEVRVTRLGEDVLTEGFVPAAAAT